MFNLEKLIGLKYSDAINILIEENISFRSVKKDGHYYIVTRDFKPDRVNLEIENNIIIKVHFG